MRRLFLLLFLPLLLLQASHAETIAATYGYTTVPLSYSIAGAGPGTCFPTSQNYGSDAAGACNSWWSTSLANCPTNQAMQGVTASVQNGWCIAGNWGTPLNRVCPVNYTIDNTANNCKSTTQNYTCPDGYTLSDQNCTRPDCPNGTPRNPDGSCQSACQQVADLTNNTPQATRWFTVPVGSGNAMGSYCDSGCAVSLAMLEPGYYTDGKNNSMQRKMHYSGQSCTSEPAAPAQFTPEKPNPPVPEKSLPVQPVKA